MGGTWTPSQEVAMTLHGKALLVSAAAGSGKTSVLTERIIRTLLDETHPADPSRMLIVTFTRAAAAEMKGRIIAALSEELARNPGNKYISKQLFLAGNAQISTIDSFFQKIVKANFEQLSLPASFRMADSGELLSMKSDILDTLLEEYYRKYDHAANDTALFTRLEENDFAEVIDHLMSTRSDGQLNTVLLKFTELFSAEPNGFEVLQDCVKTLQEQSETEYFDTPYGRTLHTYLTEWCEGACDYLSALWNYLETAPDMMSLFAGIAESDLRYCRAMQEALAEGHYDRVREVAFTFIPGRFPTCREKTNEILIYREWRNKFKTDIAEKIQKLLKTPQQQIASQMRHTATLAQILYNFCTDYHNRLLTEKKERGVLEFDDVRNMLYDLLNNHGGQPSDLAETLRAQYDAVYIDEYQDVDRLQDRIFSIIGGNRRFMVGDIKQSIYGFRGSDPSIFADYRRLFPLYTHAESEQADGITVFMSENFRCNEPIIRFTNLICSYLFSACEKSIGYRRQDDLVFAKKMPESLPEQHPLPVEFAVFEGAPRKKAVNADDNPSETDDVREEAVWVASEISRLLREEKLDDGSPITPQDIAILVRSRAHGNHFAAELKKLKIPVAAASANNILQEPGLIDLLNFLRAVDNPYRDLPLSEYLLSSFGGYTLEEIATIRQTLGDEYALYDAMYARANANDALADKLSKTLTDLEEHRTNAAILSADRFLRLLYTKEPFVRSAKTPAFLFLYDQARIFQRSAFCDLYGFLIRMTRNLEKENLSADGFKKSENAVTVITMHHSKGLEFPVVFLCSTGTSFNKDDLKKNLLYHRNVGLATRLYNRETGETEDTALRTAVKLQIDQEQAEENIRTLYVALTRARERLYVTGTVRGKKENALTSAALIRCGNRLSILGASNPLQWMLAAISTKSSSLLSDSSFRLQFFPFGTIHAGTAIQTETFATDSSPVFNSYSVRCAEICQRQSQIADPSELLHKLPSKAAASKLHPTLLDTFTDEDEEKSLQTQLDFMCAAPPSFDTLLREKEPTATDIGTATHTFLEFCDFRSLLTQGVEEESLRLQQEGYLSQNESALLNQRQLEQFRNSDLMQLILQAKNVRREQRFNLLIPMTDLTQRPELAVQLKKHSLFVQGSIDLLLETESNGLILVDYKTDAVRPEEIHSPDLLKEKWKQVHGNQLSYYAKAVQQLFGKEPDEIRIYSLPLGRTVKIDLH